MKIGDYIRTGEGYIGKIIDINHNNWNYITIDCNRKVRRDYNEYPENYLYLKKGDIKKYSSKIINILEVGDIGIVDGVKYTIVRSDNKFNGKLFIQIIGENLHYSTIEYLIEQGRLEAIIPKEQLKNIQYKLN